MSLDDESISNTAAFIASRFCLQRHVILKWMEHCNVKSLDGVLKKFRGIDEDQKLYNALTDVWSFIDRRGGLHNV